MRLIQFPAPASSAAAGAAFACGCEAFCNACAVEFGLVTVDLAADGVNRGACGRTAAGAGFFAAVDPGAVEGLACGLMGAGTGFLIED